MGVSEEGDMTDTLRQREGDQPLPTPNARPFCHDAVIEAVRQRAGTEGIAGLLIEDINARRVLGISRYGTALQPMNGRDVMRDLLEEVLDALAYGQQLRMEWREQMRYSGEFEMVHMKSLLNFALWLRRELYVRDRQ